MNEVFHKPALLNETIEFLNIKPGLVYIDATFGGGGHSLGILNKGGKVIGIDWDFEAINHAKEKFKKEHQNKNLKIIQGNFVNLREMMKRDGVNKIAGIMFDLGTSFHQVLTPGRGFSFNIDEPLDMRMSKDLTVTAEDLINGLNKGELYELFTRLGEEHLALPISKAICGERKINPIKNTGRLAQIAAKVYQKYNYKTKINPATKVFQALRIAVNDELNNLRMVLPQALEICQKGGRIVVISFQGLEDRIVKEFFKDKEIRGIIKVLTKKPIVPTVEEIISNPRCRSAKLRAIEKL